MTPEQAQELMGDVDRLGMLVTAVLVLQAVISIALMMAHRKIARNEVELADLIRQAVDKLQAGLPNK